LGDIPILGSLFRSVSYQTGETELLVLVTVDIVEPMDDQVLLPMPGELHEAPSDWEFYSEGALEKGDAARIASSEAPYIRELGLEGLKGPGAWAYYGQSPARLRPASPEPGQVEEESADTSTADGDGPEPSM
jgi:pilus assembly protein CpaC